MRLDDPIEYALIKKIYFNSDLPINQEIDPIERLERMEAKQRNNKNSR